MAQSYQHQTEESWMQTRNLEYASYTTTFGMNGKKIFKGIKKPQDLYKLPTEIRVKKTNTAVFDLDRAEEALNKSNNKPKWI